MDADAKQAIDSLQEEVRQLNERVIELEDRVSELENTGVASTTGDDQYDKYVLERIQEVGKRPTPEQIITLYKEAGVRDVKKIKDRQRFLTRTEKIDEVLSND